MCGIFLSGFGVFDGVNFFAKTPATRHTERSEVSTKN